MGAERRSLTFRGAITLCIGAVTLCFALLVGAMMWQQARSQNLAEQADMARRQALLVTRLEADLAHRLLGTGEGAGEASGDARLAETARAYLATVENERALIGDDEGTLDHQAREALAADRFAMLTRGRPTAAQIAQASAMASEIAIRENREAEAAAREARTVRHQTGWLILAAILLLWGVFLTAAFLTWRTVIQPIHSLIRATDAVAAETAPSRVRPAGFQELRRLIRHFNGMAQAIEEQVARRTDELEEANRALRDIDQRRRLFLSKVSHELRTPVTVMRGEAEVALRLDEDAAGLRESLGHILDSNLFLQRRLDDLLALALAEDGALPLNAERLDLAQVVQQVGQAAATFARSSGVRLDVAGIDRAVPVLGDADRLRQALVAIIDNSVKFSPPGGTVSLRVDIAEGQSRITVSDEGPGVAEEDLERIFDPYAQTRAGRSRGGTGLGLSLARWIAQAHKGVIAARNGKKGEGLCVSLTLPVLA